MEANIAIANTDGVESILEAVEKSIELWLKSPEDTRLELNLIRPTPAKLINFKPVGSPVKRSDMPGKGLYENIATGERILLSPTCSLPPGSTWQRLEKVPHPMADSSKSFGGLSGAEAAWAENSTPAVDGEPTVQQEQAIDEVNKASRLEQVRRAISDHDAREGISANGHISWPVQYLDEEIAAQAKARLSLQVIRVHAKAALISRDIRAGRLRAILQAVNNLLDMGESQS